MSENKFLPGFDVAPGSHRNMVRNPEGGQISYYSEKPDPAIVMFAIRELRDRRKIAGALSDIVLDQSPNLEDPDGAAKGWRMLKDEMHTWFGGLLDAIHIPCYRPGFITEHAAREHVEVAAFDGISTDIAFLETVPKVLFRREFSDANTEIATWARSSVGFIVAWAGLDDDVDMKLAWALAEPKPRRQREVFDDLHFDPKWFKTHESSRQIGLDPSRIPRLRDESNDHPNAAHFWKHPLFACPAGKLIPELHFIAVEAAKSIGLFERTWLEERANTGYPEAWIALEGIRNSKGQ